MGPKKKPGPLSSKSKNNSKSLTTTRSRIENNPNYGLRDEDTSSDDDRTPVEQQTDYGLEFTNSSMPISPPSGSSTLRGTSRYRNSRTNLSTPTSARRRTSARLTEMPATSTSVVRHLRGIQEEGNVSSPSHSSVARAGPSTAPRNTARVRPRKQRNPISTERRLYKEIVRLQNEIRFLIPRLPFGRVVRELLMSASYDPMRITFTALQALQESAEYYLTQRLEDAYLLTLHRGRKTLELRDMRLAAYLKPGIQ